MSREYNRKNNGKKCKNIMEKREGMEILFDNIHKKLYNFKRYFKLTKFAIFLVYTYIYSYVEKTYINLGLHIVIGVLQLRKNEGHMVRIRTSELTPGMVLASDVYNHQDQLIMPAGTILSEKAIKKLSFYSIYFVKVEEPEKKEVVLSYSERVRESEEFKEFHEEFFENVDLMKAVIQDIVDENVTVEAVDQVVNDALQMLQVDGVNINVFDMLHNMRQYDDQTFAHSMNVALICHVLAKWLGMSDEEVKLAFTCGIFHDVGKTKIPEEVINKVGKLSKEEFDFIKSHPIEGYNMLKNIQIDEHVKKAALMHHERFDGTGYPIGMRGKEIDKYARIVAIADVYEAMTSARRYRGGISPFEVVSTFEKEGLQKYDTHMIMTFLEKLADNYMLNRVRLSNGMEGEIVFINKHALSRPVIKCENNFIDLSKDKSIEIEEII